MRKATTLLTILASLFFYAFALSTPASADPDGPGNNGTVKIVNEQGDGQDDPDNDPHVCLFHIYGFHFDDNSSGTWRIEVWAPGGGPLTTSQSSGVWKANAIGQFDARPAPQPLPNGHYKLFVKQTAPTTPGGDKQKVFWVKCGNTAAPTPTPTPVTGGTTTVTGGTTTVTGGTTTVTGGTTTIVGGTVTVAGGTTTTTTGGVTTTFTGGTTTIVGGTTTITGSTTTNTGGTVTNSGGAVLGFQSAPGAVGSVSPIIELPGGSNQVSPGSAQGGAVAGIQSLPSTSTDSAPTIPLAAIGLAIMAAGGLLLRRREEQL